MRRITMLALLALVVLSAAPALDDSEARTIEVITVEDPSCASGSYTWMFVWEDNFIVYMDHGCTIIA